MVILSAVSKRYPDYIGYFALYASLYGLFSVSDRTRIDFLKQHFGFQKTIQIRWVENFAVTLPWLYIALLGANWHLLLLLLLLIFSWAFITPKRKQRSLPTPFSKSPFEFIIFFRRYFVYLLAIALVLTGIACYYRNFNLALVCLGVLLFVGCSAHDFRESEFFVWSYKVKPSRFLKMKVFRATSQMTILACPFLFMIILTFPSQQIMVLLCLLIGLVLQALFVLFKYAVYPRTFVISDGFALVIAIALPLTCPFIAYKFYYKAKNNLQKWL